ncbi:DUF2812 domain-containing protein [Planococcus sp. YIM B11945]|uniref:DUF2812 domain-containing protein n=1 Tax=Planococcus sp. YIM B11945 TaxID=3435410 RepID=UPI003D7E13A7
MKTLKKFKLFLSADLEKEAEWLTQMSEKGFHFVKHKGVFYYFEEDSTKSYIYQTDFQEPNDEYFQLYELAGWEHVHTAISQFHYFRAEKDKIGDQRIYSDASSIKNMYQRMLSFYLVLFLCVIVAQTGVFLTWEGHLYQKIALALVLMVVVLYVFLFAELLRKMKKHKNSKG